MIATRFWIGLLGLSLSVAVLVGYLAVSMHDRLGVRLAAEGLSADSRVVSWYLKNSAREGAAQLIRFAGNDSVARTLAGASRAERGEIDASTRRQLKSTLAKIAQELPKDEAFDAIFAVSQTGEVVASVGFDQASDPEFELGGYPVVADALHGYVRDDTLVLDRLYRVMARPVEFELGQLPAGAIVGARVVDDRFAAELSERTGAAVAFYNGGRRIALGAPSTFDRSGLDQIVTDLPSLEQDADYRDKGRTDVHPFPDGLAVVYARLPGEAWKLGAGYAVARHAPRVQGIGGVLKHADSKDKEAVSTLVLLAIALVSIGVGLALSFVEYSLPLKAFKQQIKALSGGKATQLTVDRMRGPFRQLALDLNLAFDRAPRSTLGDESAIAVGFDQVFGDAPASSPPMAAFGVPGSVPPGSFAGLPPASTEVSAPQYGQVSAAVGYDMASGTAAARGAVPPRRGRSGAQPEPAFPVAAVAGVGAVGGGLSGGGLSGGGAVMAAGMSASAGGAAVALAQPVVQADHPPAMPRVAPVEGALNGASDVEPEWTQVYNDFVRLKQDCGEATEGFTFERFTQELRKNRDKLRRDHGVQRVHFSAYVKQGRAALKAKPIRD